MFFPKFIIKSVLLLGLFTIMAIANPLFSQNKKEKLEENKKRSNRKFNTTPNCSMKQKKQNQPRSINWLF